MAVNIMRGRDHGLADYQTARKQFGLKTLTSFRAINQFNGILMNDPFDATFVSLFVCLFVCLFICLFSLKICTYMYFHIYLCF